MEKYRLFIWMKIKRMPTNDEIEKARQAIMRLRELLDIMRAQLEEGEQVYQQLFAHVSAEDKAALKEKELQRVAAFAVLEDSTLLSNAALHLRFVARNLEKDFEQLYDNLMTE